MNTKELISLTKWPALLLLTGMQLACESRLPWGDGNSIVAAMPTELWEEVSEDVYRELEPTIRTVREEEMFTVTHVDPTGEDWHNFRRFRVMLVVGRAEDWYVAEALENVTGEVEGPGLHLAEDVWARDQSVTILLLSAEGGADEIRASLPLAHERFDAGFRRYVINRLYTSGPDSAQADTLRQRWGFELLLPKVYSHDARGDVHIFRNDNPDPSELIRQIAVTWRSPMPMEMQPEDLVQWRNQLVNEHYNYGQILEIRPESSGPVEFRGLSAYEIRGQWQNPPDLGWPAAGMVIFRGVPCGGQDRMYLIDTWFYAPGREHYEYVIQLETILGTFRCGAGP